MDDLSKQEENSNTEDLLDKVSKVNNIIENEPELKNKLGEKGAEIKDKIEQGVPNDKGEKGKSFGKELSLWFKQVFETAEKILNPKNLENFCNLIKDVLDAVTKNYSHIIGSVEEISNQFKAIKEDVENTINTIQDNASKTVETIQKNTNKSDIARKIGSNPELINGLKDIDMTGIMEKNSAQPSTVIPGQSQNKSQGVGIG